MGVLEEIQAVADPTRQASDSTERLIRINPLTAGYAGVADAVAFSQDGRVDNPLIDETSTADTVFDTVWEGHDGDTVDVLGPAMFGTEGSVADVLVRRQGETQSLEETKTSALLVGIVALVVLYLLGPILGPVLESVLGGDDE